MMMIIIISISIIIAICFGFLGLFQTMIASTEIRPKKQAQDRKTHFETVSLPVAKILSPVARQAPTFNSINGLLEVNAWTAWSEKCSRRLGNPAANVVQGRVSM